MTDEENKTATKAKRTPARAKPRATKASTPAASEPYQATQQSAAPKAGELAASEFGKIVKLINTVPVTRTIVTSEGECPENPRWCLPDINCTARVTLSNDYGVPAFKDNQDFCKETIAVESKG